MDNRITLSLGVVTLVLLAGCAGLAGGADAPETGVSETDVSDRTIEVAVEGEASSEPDQATLYVSVTASGEDPEAVRTELANGNEELRAALIDYGLDEDDVRTERYYVRESRESRTEADVEEYRGEHRLAVDVDDVDSVGAVVDVAVDNGADTVGRISFGLSPEREAEIREEALNDAMDGAKDDASVLAAEAGLEVVGVVTISTADTRVDGHTARYTADVAHESAGDAATGIEAGDVDVTVQVRVVYEAEER